jgi:hypothetical protein
VSQQLHFLHLLQLVQLVHLRRSLVVPVALARSAPAPVAAMVAVAVAVALATTITVSIAIAPVAVRGGGARIPATHGGRDNSFELVGQGLHRSHHWGNSLRRERRVRATHMC